MRTIHIVTDGINVLRKYALFVGVAAIGALVTSCGGDDDDTPTPTPTVTSTATPTPTPTSSTVLTLQDDFAPLSTNANYAFAFFTPDGGGAETFSGASRQEGLAAVGLELSPELASFRFVDQTSAVTFDGTELTAASATLRSYARGTEKLVMELPGAYVLRVSYESQADFTQGTTDGVLRGERTALFFTGVTTTDDITTNLTYTGSVEAFGGDPQTTLSNAITSPDTTFTINASDDSVNGTIEIYRNVAGTPQLVTTLTFQRTVNGTGAVTGGVLNDADAFTGVLTDSANNFAGNFAGSLAGPNREELFIIFSISGNENDDDDRRFVGSFIGRR